MRRKLRFLFFAVLFSGCVYGQQDYILISGDDICPPDTVGIYINPDSLDLSTLTFNPILRTGVADLVVDFSSYGPYEVVYTVPGNYLVTLISGEDQSEFARNTVNVRQRLSSQFEAQVVNEPYEYQFVPTDELEDSISSYSFIYTISQNSLPLDTSQVFYATANTLNNARYTYTFPDTGTYSVELTTQRSIISCAQSLEADVIVGEQSIPGDSTKVPIANYFAPNAHTYFIIDPRDPEVVLSFKLFSRSGVLVFSTESPVVYWDGRNSNGQEMGTGVYFYVLEALQGDIGNTEKKGFIHLFRD